MYPVIIKICDRYKFALFFVQQKLAELKRLYSYTHVHVHRISNLFKIQHFSLQWSGHLVYFVIYSSHIDIKCVQYTFTKNVKLKTLKHHVLSCNLLNY